MKRKRIPEYVKDQLFVDQDGACNHCGEKLERTEDNIPLFDIDHIVQHALTRNDDIENLQILCVLCHRIKTIREMRERKRAIRPPPPPPTQTERKRAIRPLTPPPEIIINPDNESNPFLQFAFKNNDKEDAGVGRVLYDDSSACVEEEQGCEHASGGSDCE